MRQGLLCRLGTGRGRGLGRRCRRGLPLGQGAGLGRRGRRQGRRPGHPRCRRLRGRQGGRGSRVGSQLARTIGSPVLAALQPRAAPIGMQAGKQWQARRRRLPTGEGRRRPLSGRRLLCDVEVTGRRRRRQRHGRLGWLAQVVGRVQHLLNQLLCSRRLVGGQHCRGERAGQWWWRGCWLLRRLDTPLLPRQVAPCWQALSWQQEARAMRLAGGLRAG